MMIIQSAKFITSAVSAADFGKFALPEIAVAGRSNAGKSSFINMIANNGKLARTSKEAGKTRCVNYYQINAECRMQNAELKDNNSQLSILNCQFHLTDLPGYGYSAAGKAATETFSALTDEYIRLSKNLLHVLLLADIRILPTKNDLQLIDFLFRCQKPFTILAVKSDKLSRAQIETQRNLIARELKLGRDDIVAVSNVTGDGKDKVLALFDDIIGTT